MNTKTTQPPVLTTEEEVALDFGDLPEFDESFEDEEDELYFYGLKISGTRPSDLKNPKTAKSYSDYLLKEGFSILFKENPYHDSDGKFTSKENDWQKTGGQKGSNPGGVYVREGESFYVKFPSAKGQSMAEEVADSIHEAMGAKTMGHKTHDIGGKEASVSSFNKDMQILGKSGWDNMTEPEANQAAKIILASMLVKNWDVVGLTHDNIARNKKTGDLHIVDTGGSFKFRAQGAPKPFDTNAQSEIDGMFSPDKTSGRVVGPMFKKYPQAFKAALGDLKKLTRGDFEKLTSKMKDPTVVDTLIERQQGIVRHFS